MSAKKHRWSTDRWEFFSKTRNMWILILAGFLACAGLYGMDATSSDVWASLFLIYTAVLIVLRLVAGRKMKRRRAQEPLYGEEVYTHNDRRRPCKTSFESASDPIEWLEECDYCQAFFQERQVLARVYEQIERRESLFADYDADSPFKEAYKLIRRQINNDIKACGQFMNSFYPSDTADRSFVYERVHDANQLVPKLEKLVDAALSTKSESEDVDLSYVDDLLEALKKLQRS